MSGTIGTNQADILCGTTGDDTINSGNGKDFVDGGAGSDIISTGNGKDEIQVTIDVNQDGQDVIDGELGKDTLKIVGTQSQIDQLAAAIAAFQAWDKSMEFDFGQFLDVNGGDRTLFDVKVINVENLVVEVVDNSDPVADEDTNMIFEDQVSVSGDVLTNDSDPNWLDELSVDSFVFDSTLSTSLTDHGDLTVNPDGTYTYELDNTDAEVQALGVGQSLFDVFQVTITDDNGGFATNTLTIEVKGANDVPVYTVFDTNINDTVFDGGNEDAVSFSIDLLDPQFIDDPDTNDTHMLEGDPDAVTLDALMAPAGVTISSADAFMLSGSLLSLVADSRYQVLGFGETATLSFTSRIRDSGADPMVPGPTASASFDVEITGVNDRPTLSVADETTNEDATNPFEVNILSQASDIDTNDTLSINSLDLVNIAENGVTVQREVIFSETETGLSFDPNQFNDLAVGDTVVLTFSATVIDDSGQANAESDPDMFLVTIEGRNDTPVANSDDYSTNEDTTLIVSAPGVLDDDEDDDEDPLTAKLITDVSNGMLMLNSDGSFEYTPDVHFSGLDSFTYAANDGTADSNTATVQITVNAVADAPTINADNIVINEQTREVSFDLQAFLVDLDGSESLSVKATTVPAGVDLSPTALGAGVSDNDGTHDDDADVGEMSVMVSLDPSTLDANTGFTVEFTATAVEGSNSDDASTILNVIAGTNPDASGDLDEILYTLASDSTQIGFFSPSNLAPMTLGPLDSEVGTIIGVGDVSATSGDEVLYTLASDSTQIGFFSPSNLAPITLGPLDSEVGTIIGVGDVSATSGDEVLYTLASDSTQIGFFSPSDLAPMTLGPLDSEVGTIIGVGNVTATLSGGDDTLSSTTNSDVFVGFDGADTFAFDLSQTIASDLIADFNAAEDILQFSNVSMSDQISVADDGDDVRLTIGENAGAGDGGSILILDIGNGTISDLTELATVINLQGV